MLFLLLVRGSGANLGAAIFWQLIEMSGLLDGVYTELHRVVHRALSAIQNNGVAAFQGEFYTGRIGPIVGTLESVRIIEVSDFQGCPQGGVPLYSGSLAMLADDTVSSRITLSLGGVTSLTLALRTQTGVWVNSRTRPFARNELPESLEPST